MIAADYIRQYLQLTLLCIAWKNAQKSSADRLHMRMAARPYISCGLWLAFQELPCQKRSAAAILTPHAHTQGGKGQGAIFE